MNILRLTMHELRMIHASGIIWLYVGLTIAYLFVLWWLDPVFIPKAVTYIIFTDPAALGMAFMGASVLLEKNQGVTSALVVSPIQRWQYIASKVLAYMILGSVVAGVISLADGSRNHVMTIIGVACTSIGYSLMGMIIGFNVRSLNGYMVQTVIPVIGLALPALVFLLGYLQHPIWLIHPGIAVIAIIMGEQLLIAIVSVLVWNLALVRLTYTTVSARMGNLEQVAL